MGYQARKKWFLLMIGLHFHQWWRLLSSPANNNESLMLELSGFGNPQTEQELGDIIRAQGPSVMFLAETWLDKARLLFIRDKLRFEGLLEFSREGRGGRVAILWKKEVDFSVDIYLSNHIDDIINKGKDDGWRFIGFYGEPDTRSHHIS